MQGLDLTDIDKKQIQLLNNWSVITRELALYKTCTQCDNVFKAQNDRVRLCKNCREYNRLHSNPIKPTNKDIGWRKHARTK